MLNPTSLAEGGPPGGAEGPLGGLKLASHAALERARGRGRAACPRCGASRMFFCYTCCATLCARPGEVPTVQLPLPVDIVKHPHEANAKSTAVHAKILAPAHVTIYTYPALPDFRGQKHVVLVFPGPEAETVEEMTRRLAREANEPRAKRSRGGGPSSSSPPPGGPGGPWPLERVVFIDSTWSQSRKISADERLQDLPRVELRGQRSCFWRRQRGKPDTHLSTIEAVYYFFRELHGCCAARGYDGEYDNLLFYFSYLRKLVAGGARS